MTVDAKLAVEITAQNAMLVHVIGVLAHLENMPSQHFLAAFEQEVTTAIEAAVIEIPAIELDADRIRVEETVRALAVSRVRQILSGIELRPQSEPKAS